jgi:ADP-heptose:LPS heptosyltransferase
MRTGDFSDTAEVINKLDFVVTVDTAVAHLAGALGKKTYLLLSYTHDFKWGNKDTTPWYSSISIIRQKEPGNWDSVFTKLMDMLK